MQAPFAVEGGVLQGVDDVEAAAPRHHQQREDTGFEGDTPRDGDIGPDGRDAERKPQHQMGQRGKAFAVAVEQNDEQRHG